jgi:RNA polymerase sigma factor (sigma-70 family)
MDGQGAMAESPSTTPTGVRRDVRNSYQAAFVAAYERYYTKVFALWWARCSSDPEDDALRGEAVSSLMAHVARLSQRDQELLALKFEGELSYTEMSRVLHMSEVNVRVSIFRALKRLRELMKEGEH